MVIRRIEILFSNARNLCENSQLVSSEDVGSQKREAT